jgi:hypothetical protein
VPHCPSDGRDEKPEQEHCQEARKHEVKGLGLLGNDFFPNIGLMWVNGLVIIIADAVADVGGCAAELACKWGPFGMNPKSLVKLDVWVAVGRVFVPYALDGVVYFLEVTMFIGVFTPEIADHIAVMEVECYLQHAKADCPLPEREGSIDWVIPWEP